MILKFKTSIINSKDAERIGQLIRLFFSRAIIHFDLKHEEKILSIQSPFEEYNPVIVVRILNTYGFACTDISTQ